MLKISSKAQYGLRAMVFLAKAKKISSLKEISVKEGISFDYLEKIISTLEKSGLIRSKKGVQGGYCLKVKPEKIKMGRIIRCLEGKTHLVKCMEYFCPKEKNCLTRTFWKKIQKSLDGVLDSITLADLLKGK